MGAGNYAAVMKSAISIYPNAAVPGDVAERHKGLKD